MALTDKMQTFSSEIIQLISLQAKTVYSLTSFVVTLTIILLKKEKKRSEGRKLEIRKVKSDFCRPEGK